MTTNKFPVAHDDDSDIWAVAERDTFVFRQGKLGDSATPTEPETLFEIAKDEVRRLTAWGDPSWITISLSGQLAKDVRDSAQELGLLPENFAIEAVNAFIQASRMEHS